MTTAIDANGHAVPTPTHNLTTDNELGFSARDVHSEKIANGYYHTADNYIPDEQIDNNPEVVIRDGSRQHANGEYQPGDLVVIGGMEIAYEDAASLGLLKGETLNTPADNFMSDAENTRAELQQAQQQDTRPEAAQLLEAQLEVAVGEGNADAALATFQNDIVYNGEIGEEGFAFAQEKLGMSEQSVAALYEDMRDTGDQVMAQYMETGDGLGAERIEFLADKAFNGNQKEQAIVRNLWFMAATGKLSAKDAAEAFDFLYAPYEGAE
ncbi:MAG: hypothetical protein RID11_16625 [Roseovarius sp.]|jgi:hypothetical protein|uniref:hypothetical protein n=1 Tax=Roseovarius sp. TaxID=1486281 RepID=UPI0032F09CBA